MLKVEVLKKLENILDSITKGNYSVGKEIEQLLDNNKYPQEVNEFAESLNLMTLKLEAREHALENAIDSLKQKNIELTDSISKREFLSSFFTILFLFITIFIFLINIVQQIPSMSNVLSRTVEVVFILISIFIVKKSKLPLRNFGLKIKGSLKSISESMVFSVILIGIMFILRYIYRDSNIPEFQGELFSYSFLSFEAIIYIPICFVQEFLTRGIAQTAIEFGLEHKYKQVLSIIITSFIFGVIHITTSIEFAIISIILCCCWGYLYSRSRTIIGVSISHYLIGMFAWSLGFWDYLT